MKKYFALIAVIFIGLQSITSLDFSDRNEENILLSLQKRSSIEKTVILANYIISQPDNPILYKLKAKEEILLNDYRGARDTIITARQNGITNLELTYMLGVSYFYLKEYDDAKTIFQNIIIDHPQDQTAAFFLSLIKNDTPSENKTDKYPDYKLLETEYMNDNTNDPFPYFYLYQSKEIDVIDKKSYDYTITGIIRINKNTSIDDVKNYQFSYDSSIFVPTSIDAMTITAEGLTKKITDTKILSGNEAETKNIYKNTKFIKFPFTEISAGSIACYKIHFKYNGKEVPMGFTDTFLIASQTRVYKKEYIVNYPADAAPTFVATKTDIDSEVTKTADKIQAKYSLTYPPYVYLNNETVNIYDISPAISITTFTEWDKIAAWYYKIFKNQLDKSKKISIPVENKQDKMVLINDIYQYVQSELNYDGIDFCEGGYTPQTADETFKTKYARSNDLSTLFIHILTNYGITSNPVLISTAGNRQPVIEIPDPYAFNKVIVYIPQQTGVKDGLYVDVTNKFTTIGNLPYEDQGVKYLKLSPDTGNTIGTTPILEYDKNVMAEDYKVNIDDIGRGSVLFKQEIKGSFSEYFRSQLADLNESEKEEYFLKMQRESFPDIKKEEFTLNGIKSQSGDISMEVKTATANITEIQFDGKQILNFNLGAIKDWVDFPAQANFTFRKNFAYTYKKKMEFIFPEGYSIAEQNLSNISRQNKYLVFDFTADKINDNHFILQYELGLKSIYIEPSDLPVLNAYIDYLSKSVNFKIVMEKSENFDYESFFSKLKDEYKQSDVYKNYINRLITDNKNDKAISVAMEAKEIFPADPYFNIIISMIYFDQGKFDTAENDLNEALQKSTNKLPIYGYLIELYKKTNDKDKLFKTLDEAYKLYPSELALVSELVEYYRVNNRIDDAIAFLETITEKYPENPIFFADLGFMYSMTKDFEKAEKNLKKAIQLDPESSYALNNLAWLYCENRVNIKEAISYSEKACEIDPNNDNFFDTLAEAYYNDKQYDKAIEAIKKAIQINPSQGYLKSQLEKIEKAKNNENIDDNADVK